MLLRRSLLGATETTQKSRSQRAFLTFISRMLNQGAAFVTQMFVTPYVVHGLGAELYGAWQMIQQSVGYLSLTDLKPLGALKLRLAAEQHSDDLDSKRRLIGSSLQVWAIMAPFICTMAFAVVWFSPYFIRVGQTSATAVAWAMGISAASVVLTGLVQLPGTVLMGMNLEYKRMGGRAIIKLLLGFSTAVAVWAGYGLIGVAAATYLAYYASAFYDFNVARKVIPWFGVAKPDWNETKGLVGLSSWVFLSAIAMQVFSASDLLIIGFVLDPTQTAIYSINRAVLQMGSMYLYDLLGSGLSGIGELWGRRELVAVKRARYDMQVLAIFIMSVVGTGVISLNRSFILLWVGKGYYADPYTNVLLVLVFLQATVSRADAMIIDATMQIRVKAASLFLSGVLSTCAAICLLPLLGLAGAALGMLIGRTVLSVHFPYIISKLIGEPIGVFVKGLIRGLVTCCILYVMAFICDSLFLFQTWRSLIFAGIIIGVCSSLAAWYCGVQKVERLSLVSRIPSRILHNPILGRIVSWV